MIEHCLSVLRVLLRVRRNPPQVCGDTCGGGNDRDANPVQLPAGPAMVTYAAGSSCGPATDVPPAHPGVDITKSSVFGGIAVLRWL